MTALIGPIKTIALAALAAFGLLVAGGQFTSGETADVASGPAAKRAANTETGRASTSITTHTSAHANTTSNSTSCLDNCLAPCATDCADPQRPPLDGAVQEGAAFGAAVAPEHPTPK